MPTSFTKSSIQTPVAIDKGGTNATTASGARTNLGIAIGSDVQAYSANLDEYAAVNPTTAGLALLDDANAAAQLVTLGLTATATELNYTDGVTSGIQTQIDGKQPLDTDLTTLAGLTATTDNFIVSVASAWASRTPAQAKTTLSLNNVDNTSDASKPVSTATQTALDAKAAHATTITIAGTANEITSSTGAQDLSANRTWTLSLPSSIDLGGKTLEIPNGAGGTTVNTAGQVTIDTTSKTLNYYTDAEYVLNPIQSKSITVETPTAAEDISMFYTDEAITVSKLVFSITGSTSVTTTIRHSTDRSASGNEVVTGGTVANNTTTGNVVTSFNDATIPADSFVWLETTALSGTPTSLNVTVFFRQDA